MIISLPEWMSEYDPEFIYEEIKVMSLSGNVKYKKLLKKIKKELCGMKDCCCETVSEISHEKQKNNNKKRK
jgi:hypothetical protein